MKKYCSKLEYGGLTLFIEWREPFILTRLSFQLLSGMDFIEAPDDRALLEFTEQLRKWWTGENMALPKVSLDWGKVTAFQQRILECLQRNVPRGQVISYGELAALAGCPGGARAVGNAMNCNPFPVLFPCHRVVKSDLGLGGFGCGTEIKEKLLGLECITIKNSRIMPEFRFLC